jgi:hypothetical protein
MFHVMALRDFVEKFPEYDDRHVGEGFNAPSGTETSGNGATVKAAVSEQAPNYRRVGPLQTRRWEIP